MDIVLGNWTVVNWLLTLWILSRRHCARIVKRPVLRRQLLRGSKMTYGIARIIYLLLLTVMLVTAVHRTPISIFLTIVVIIFLLTLLIVIKMVWCIWISVPYPMARSASLWSMLTSLPTSSLLLIYCLSIVVFILCLCILIRWFSVVICSLGGLCSIIAIIKLIHWHFRVVGARCIWHWGALQLEHLLLRLLSFLVEIDAEAENDE